MAGKTDTERRVVRVPRKQVKSTLPFGFLASGLAPARTMSGTGLRALMPRTRFICAGGNPALQGETRPKLASSNAFEKWDRNRHVRTHSLTWTGRSQRLHDCLEGLGIVLLKKRLISIFRQHSFGAPYCFGHMPTSHRASRSSSWHLLRWLHWAFEESPMFLHHPMFMVQS